VVEEVWSYLDPEATTSYRDFWKSEAFYKISRVRHGGSDCKVAFIASRFLAFSKLDWDEQWFVLTGPRSVRNHINWQLPLVVDAFWSLMYLPVWDWVARKPWSSFLWGRISGHMKKLKYFLMSDGMPLLTGRLPFSDLHDDARDGAFQELVTRRLNLRLPLPLEEAEGYASSSIFGEMTAALVVAYVRASQGARAAAREVLGAVDAKVHGWVERNDYSDLFFTSWPVMRLLHGLSDLLAEVPEEGVSTAQTKAHAGANNPDDLPLVISCSVSSTSTEGPWAFKASASGEDCAPFVRKAVAEATGSSRRWVLLLNPSLNWTAHMTSIGDGLQLASQEQADLTVGFPTVSHNGTWYWPVRRLGMTASSLRYTDYPTGYAGKLGYCASGGTTSGTRAYRLSTLQTLLAKVKDASTMESLLMQLDLLGYEHFGRDAAAITCMVPPLVEEDYLLKAEMPESLAQSRGWELLDVLGRLRLFCKATHGEEPLSGALSPCEAVDVEEAAEAVTQFWASRGGTVVAEYAVGSVLPGAAGRGLRQGASKKLGRLRLEGGGANTREDICGELTRLGFGCPACGAYGRGCLDVVVGETSHASAVTVKLWGQHLVAGDFTEPSSLGTQLCKAKVFLLYCGPLKLDTSLGRLPCAYIASSRPVAQCATTLREAAHRVPHEAFALLLSPYLWDETRATPSESTILDLQKVLHQNPEAVAAGIPIIGHDKQWHWPAQDVDYRYYKLHYRRQHGAEREENCVAGGASSGTRLYRPGALPAMLRKVVAQSPGDLMVELDLLMKLGGFPRRVFTQRRLSSLVTGFRGVVLTCALGDDASREDLYTDFAGLPESTGKRFFLEAAYYEQGSGRIHETAWEKSVNGSGWSMAHRLADQRIAATLYYRKRLEDGIVYLVNWWVSKDPAHHFATAKQGTLLTAMIRGGHVSMMPWDTDLEISLYSTGPNPVLSWCDYVLELEGRRQCIYARLSQELDLLVEEGVDLFFSQWLYEEHMTFDKFRVNIDHAFDVNFEGYVPLFPIVVPIFGRTEVRVSWPIWEYLFFEVYHGAFEKRVGTSGTIASAVDQCWFEHNACIPSCEDGLGGNCAFDFDDYFAHTRDPRGNLFPQTQPFVASALPRGKKPANADGLSAVVRLITPTIFGGSGFRSFG